MAHDLFFGKTTRNWATGADTAPPESTSRHRLWNTVLGVGALVGVPCALLLGSDYLDKTGWFKKRMR